MSARKVLFEIVVDAKYIQLSQSSYRQCCDALVFKDFSHISRNAVQEIMEQNFSRYDKETFLAGWVSDCRRLAGVHRKYQPKKPTLTVKQKLNMSLDEIIAYNKNR